MSTLVVASFGWLANSCGSVSSDLDPNHRILSCSWPSTHMRFGERFDVAVSAGLSASNAGRERFGLSAKLY